MGLRFSLLILNDYYLDLRIKLLILNSYCLGFEFCFAIFVGIGRAPDAFLGCTWSVSGTLDALVAHLRDVSGHMMH